MKEFINSHKLNNGGEDSRWRGENNPGLKLSVNVWRG